MTQPTPKYNRWDELRRDYLEAFARKAMRQAGFQIHQRRGPHRVLIGPHECGHVLELHLYLSNWTVLTLKVMTSVIFPERSVPMAAAIMLLEDNDRYAYGSMRLLRYGTGRMLVHGIVIDTDVMRNPGVAGVISQGLISQTRDTIRRLMAHGFIKPGPMAVIDSASP